MSPLEPLPQTESYLDSISQFARKTQATFATAESLTGGQIAAHLASAKDSGDWFKGGIVAYERAVKYGLLGVPEGPVVSSIAAAAMAQRTAELLGADYAVGATGVGGPDEQDGQPMGTVFLAVIGPRNYQEVTEHHFNGNVSDVLVAAVVSALKQLTAALHV